MTSAEIVCTERLAASRDKLRHALESPVAPQQDNAFAASAAAALAQLGPYAQKNPLPLVTIAFMVGGVLAWSSPKRSSLAGVLVKALVPRIAPVVAAAIAQPAWMDVVGALLRSSHQPRD